MGDSLMEIKLLPTGAASQITPVKGKRSKLKKSVSELLWKMPAIQETPAQSHNNSFHRSNIRRCQTTTFEPSCKEASTNENTSHQPDKASFNLKLNVCNSKSILFSMLKHMTPKLPTSKSAISDELTIIEEPKLHGKNGCKACEIPETSRLMVESTFRCKLCLDILPEEHMTYLKCKCYFCKKCILAYLEFEITNGAYSIACPDSHCQQNAVLSDEELQTIVPSGLFQLHKRFKLYRDVNISSNKCWCPNIDCENICTLPQEATSPIEVNCNLCNLTFCYKCREKSHEGPCQRIFVQGSIAIKYCPKCGIPIERANGCAQMMCGTCHHVFCWYCLAPLNNDFLLRHYDKGPCKNKLGHSRASVIFHRARVVAFVAGLGILFLVTSPILIMIAPCFFCFKSNLLDQIDEFDRQLEEFDRQLELAENGLDEE